MFEKFLKRINNFFMGNKSGLEMQTSEGHLGGYIVGKPAPGTWCPGIWDMFVEEYTVKSVLDVGCGLGYALDYFRGLGCNVQGIEGSPTAIENNQLIDSIIEHDFTTGALIPDNWFDLVWSAEFVEHVEERFVDNFLAAFSKSKKFVAITFATPGQGGYHHVNEQPGEYWINKLDKIGFSYNESITSKARSLVPSEGKVGKQFRNKGLIFIRNKY